MRNTIFKPFAMPQPRKPRKAKSSKRPPLAWDGVKPLKFKVVIYYKGQRYDKIVAYDIDNRRFAYMMPSGIVKPMERVSFIVQKVA